MRDPAASQKKPEEEAMSGNSFSRRTILKATAATGASVFATPLRAAAPGASPITPALIDAAKKEGKLVFYTAMDMLGLADKAAVVSANLSHGDQKLLDIGLALVLEPRVLLLDEPTAGMGSEERWQMIEKVRELWKRQNITLVFIEHDMDIVFKIAESICVLCYGRVLAEGSPEVIRGNPEVIAAYLGTSEEDEAS